MPSAVSSRTETSASPSPVGLLQPSLTITEPTSSLNAASPTLAPLTISCTRPPRCTVVTCDTHHTLRIKGTLASVNDHWPQMVGRKPLFRYFFGVSKASRNMALASSVASVVPPHIGTKASSAVTR